MSGDNVGYTKLNDPKAVAFMKTCVGLMSPPEIRLTSGLVTAASYMKIRQRIKDMKVRPDDVWVCSFPKTGTTWTQEMAWLLGNGIDFKRANSEPLFNRFPFLEFSGLCPDSMNPEDIVTIVENMPSPRFIKTHLPPAELPNEIFTVNPKIIYVHRNPKDSAISYYHHFVLWNNYTGSVEEFVESFLEDRQIYSPFWQHILEFWKLRGKKNVLINSFEEMKSDLATVMKRTADFLGVSYKKEQEAQLLDHLSFKNMKNNKMVNFEDDLREMGKENHAFIRQGEVDSWKKEMPSKYVDAFATWTEKWLEGSDFPHYRK